jgi:hypothetical protein
LKNASVAAFVIVVLIVISAMGLVSRNGGSTYTASTTTTTRTIACPTINSTQTGGSSGVQFPDYGPLLGNFSAVSVAEKVYSSGENLTILAGLLVLNRSFIGSLPVDLVNVTVKEVLSNATMVGSNGLTTTTYTSSGSQTTMGSVLGRVVSNGSMISVERSSGGFAGASQLTIVPLSFFATLASWNSSSSSALHQINRTVVTIGSSRMVVTNYEGPTVVLVELMQACGSSPSSTSVFTTSHEVIQAGIVPGTDYTLVTSFSARLALQSNSSSSSVPLNATVTEKVSSFIVG